MLLGLLTYVIVRQKSMIADILTELLIKDEYIRLRNRLLDLWLYLYLDLCSVCIGIYNTTLA